MQAQDVAAPSEMGTVQVIKSRHQKPSNELRLTQPGGKVYKPYGRKHELKKEACPAVDKVYFTCKKGVILQSSAGQQGLIISVRMKKYTSFMQLNVTIVNLL